MLPVKRLLDSTTDMRVCSDDLVGPLNPWTTYVFAEFVEREERLLG